MATRWLDRSLLAVSVVVSAALFLPGLWIGVSWANGPAGDLPMLPICLAFLAGWRLGLPESVAAAIALALATTAGDLHDALVPMVVFVAPPWAIGRVMQSRARLAAQLAARSAELEREREAYAREAVRYERARIARDLHDIVAHNLSMIVVQAAAGRRALATDAAVAAASLRHIQGGARSAEAEIEQLVELLGDSGPERGSGDLAQLDELVRRTAATGLSVTCGFSGAPDRVPAVVADVAFRVVQEGITNSLKHAPSAAIRVRVAASVSELTVAVENDPAEPTPSHAESLATFGGGFGLPGLRERVDQLGGTLEAAPTPAGGWRLVAHVPTAATARSPAQP